MRQLRFLQHQKACVYEYDYDCDGYELVGKLDGVMDAQMNER